MRRALDASGLLAGAFACRFIKDLIGWRALTLAGSRGLEGTGDGRQCVRDEMAPGGHRVAGQVRQRRKRG